MLRKLMKYEFKGNGKILLPFYGLILLLAVITKIFNGINIHKFSSLGEVAMGIVVFSYGLTMMSVMLLTAFLIVQRFSKTVYGEEGYLTHTLPVKSRDIIVSKTVSAIAWIALSGIVAIISVIIIGYNPQMLKDLAVAWEYWKTEIGRSAVREMLMILGNMTGLSILAIISGILMIYMSISIGQLFKKKLLGSIAAFLGVSFIVSTITGIIGNSPIMDMMENMVTTYDPTSLMNGMNHIMLIFGVFYIIKIAVYYFITNYLMTKKLNLE